MSAEWVTVVQEEGDEPIEIPTESDGTILLTSLTAQFPGVTGLKFRNPETNTLRGVRCSENQLFPPCQSQVDSDEPQSTWGGHTYICTRPKPPPRASFKDESALKRKSEHGSDGMSSKNQRVDDLEDVPMDSDEPTTCDLIVLGLSWKATEDDIREYFEAYGALHMIQLKTQDSGRSKGYAFIKFKDLEVQEKVLLTRHMISDRWCDVKVPESQELKNAKVNASCKIFVARLSETITPEDLKEHFEKFGPVTDVYIPKPFRSFAFVTFQEAKVAQSLFGKDHVVKGVSVHIGSAQPRMKQGGGGGGGHGGHDSHGAHGSHGGHRSHMPDVRDRLDYGRGDPRGGSIQYGGREFGGHEYGGRGGRDYQPSPWQQGGQGGYNRPPGSRSPLGRQYY